MLLAATEYVRPASLEEALTALRANTGARVLAGGQTLINVLKHRAASVDLLVDVSRLAELRGAQPLIGEVAAGTVDRQVRVRGTIGGNACFADPSSNYPPLLVALEASMEIAGESGTRSVPASEFFLGLYRTAVGPGELLRAITLPAHALAADCAFRQASLSPRGRSAALVIGRHDRDGTTVITATASVTRPLVLRFDALPEAAELGDALAAAAATGRVGYHDDVHGDPDWRRHLTALLAEQVRAELAARDV